MLNRTSSRLLSSACQSMIPPCWMRITEEAENSRPIDEGRRGGNASNIQIMKRVRGRRMTGVATDRDGRRARLKVAKIREIISQHADKENGNAMAKRMGLLYSINKVIFSILVATAFRKRVRVIIFMLVIFTALQYHVTHISLSRKAIYPVVIFW